MTEVISEQQKALNQALHQQNDQFGNRDDAAGLAKRLGVAIQRMHEMGKCNSVLDYGTGKGKLVSRLKKELPNTITVTGYDPAVEEYSIKPTKAVDILTCLDVLEHIDRDAIGDVIKDISSLLSGFLFFAIDLIPARKTLSDGRNAHIMLAPADWWSQQISAKFSFTRFVQVGETASGLRSPIQLFGWATNDRFAQKAANGFLDSIEILQKRWIILENGGALFKD